VEWYETTFERRMVDVDGATIEAFLGGSGEPVVCRSHPFSQMRVDPPPEWSDWGWIGGPGRLVCVNARGVGGSSGTQPSDFTFRRQVDDLEAVRERLGIDRWVFWGESGGGAIALLYALAYPESLLGVVAAQVAPSGRRLADDRRCSFSPNDPANRHVIASASPLARHPAILRDLRPELASAEWLLLREGFWVLTAAGRPLAVCPSGDLRVQAMWEDFVTAFEVEDRLPRIRVPTLVVAGGQDPIVPLAHTELLRDKIPRAEYAVLPESGHGFDPASAEGTAYRATVRRFLGRIAPT
jgi:proline iminopeptidase